MYFILTWLTCLLNLDRTVRLGGIGTCEVIILVWGGGDITSTSATGPTIYSLNNNKLSGTTNANTKVVDVIFQL